MGDVAMDIWTAPTLPQDILQAYQPKVDDVAEYSVDDHPKLASGKSRELFEAFRMAVLDLDECVTEEFKKLYVAYKAETNFVDVVPQAARLRLSLNVDYPEIEDPKGLCKDVTGLGRWGNGNVQVIFEQMDDLPYIIGLTRQSLEKQLGDE